MPFDSEDQFAPADPAEWARTRTIPRIIVHPKQPLPEGIDNWLDPGTDPDGGPNDWFVPGSAPADPFLNNWFGPPPTTMPSTYPAVRPDPFAAYWSQIPASRVGALAWAPPYLPPSGPSSNNNFAAPPPRTPTLGLDWSPNPAPATPPLLSGGIFGGLGALGTPPPPPASAFARPYPRLPTLGLDWSPGPAPATPPLKSGGILGGIAALGTPSPAPQGMPARPYPRLPTLGLDWSPDDGSATLGTPPSATSPFPSVGILGGRAALGTPPPATASTPAQPFPRPATLGVDWSPSTARPMGSPHDGLAKSGKPPSATPAISTAGGPASPPMPGTMQAFWDGLRAGTRQVTQSVESFWGPPTVAAERSPAAEPLGWSDLASPSGIAPKVAYQFAQSYPTLAGGVAGGVVGGRLGAFAGPEGAVAGALIGGGLGAAALSAAQTLGPVYAAELKKNPNDPEDAWNRAWRQAEISGVFSGAAWAVFPARFFQSPVKQLVFQMFGAQPALSVGQRVTSNIVEERPATEGLGAAYGQGVIGTAIPALGHGAVRPFLPRQLPIRRPSIDEPAAGRSPAEQLRARRAAQLKINSAAGRAFEDTTGAGFDRAEIDVARQLTVELPSGTQVRHDFVTRNRVTNQIGCLECKGSATAPLTPNQTRAFREMEEHESTVVGRGKPGFPPGMKIPPTKVEIRRPRK
jgi:hypothetical protein